MWNSDENYGGDLGGGFDQSSTSEKKEAKQEGQKTIVPLTVRQILEAPNDRVKIHDIEVHLATILGIVRSVEPSSIKVNYLVQDNTGCLHCVQWIDADDHEFKPLKENTWVKIVGTVKNHDGKKNMLIFSAQNIEDYNEITSHMLEVILIPNKAEQLKAATVDNNYVKMQLQSNYGDSSSAMNKSGVGVGGVSGDSARIIQVIRSLKNDEYGVDLSTIVNNLPFSLPLQEVKNLIEGLVNEGHIYTTIDDVHFQTVD